MVGTKRAQSASRETVMGFASIQESPHLQDLLEAIANDDTLEIAAVLDRLQQCLDERIRLRVAILSIKKLAVI